ncbi:DUF3618 domain-containing protein [Amycolatopsis viridis]|uniref:ElaB/YqjD/DUF883 family membrane-anchored ribosome-binding protein n=1 Tax=Amycolatopsis viridis TaxID=185678 RepID=A0ABX0T1W6_9PSEU|nr:DUF3618 domain-containing protein [Amycolatopsis viridis]NIH82753.1 ElaB/YqjD/DUF883 family membrane-anchored ribosome-binding protein [Amycolatopsis viridis]
MSTDPDRLRQEIEGTQQNLGRDVDALAEKVTPSRVVQRRVHHARGLAQNLKERVMGSTSSGVQAATDRMHQAADTATSSVSEGIQEAPQTVRRQTEGNPLAAGLIAFGAGWLVSSLFPASRPERELGGQVKDTAQGMAGPLGSAAQDMKENLRGPAQQAVESVKSTAGDAASTVADETKSAAQDVKETAQNR